MLRSFLFHSFAFNTIRFAKQDGKRRFDARKSKTFKLRWSGNILASRRRYLFQWRKKIHENILLQQRRKLAIFRFKWAQFKPRNQNAIFEWNVNQTTQFIHTNQIDANWIIYKYTMVKNYSFLTLKKNDVE